jgi:deazaflavin-dependent oxidoreductase (nitroreductase family)
LNITAIRPSWWQAALQRFFAQRFVAQCLLAPLANRLDSWVIRLTHRRASLTQILTGLPVIQLTTTGAKSGQPRTVTLLCNPDGDNLVLVATNLGKENYPAWYYNLRAHPMAMVSLNGSTRSYRSELVEGELYQRCWQQAVNLYAGYTAYQANIHNRPIPIFLLKPEDEASPQQA